MATSLPKVVLTSGVWKDLYSATGISVGTKLIIQNIGTNDVRLVESATEPLLTSGHNILPPNVFLTTATTPVGAWAYAHTGTALQVEAA